jgi:phosphate:Na+ symporter
VTNTAILIGFIPQIEKVVCWLLPNKQELEQESFKLQYIKSNLIQTPEIAVLQAQKETAHYGKRVQQMFTMVQEMLLEKDEDSIQQKFEEIEREEQVTDEAEIVIARFLEQVSEGHLSDDSKMKTRQMFREIGELESIGDSCYRLARTMQHRGQLGNQLDKMRIERIQQMMTLCDKALTQMNVVLADPLEDNELRQTYYYENILNKMRDELKADNIRAVNDKQYDYSLGTTFGDLVGELEKLGDYVVNVVEARFGQM